MRGACIDVDLAATRSLAWCIAAVGAAQRGVGAVAVGGRRPRCRCCRSGGSRVPRSSSAGPPCRAAAAPTCDAASGAADSTITNSSPPRRATSSSLARVATMRRATSRSTASPTVTPKTSLIRRKRSSSSTSTGCFGPVSSVAPSRSKSRWRFGRPVSSSNRSSCWMRRSAARRSRRSSTQTWAKVRSSLITRLAETSTGISCAVEMTEGGLESQGAAFAHVRAIAAAHAASSIRGCRRHAPAAQQLFAA